MDQKVLWKLSYGLYAIGVLDGEKKQGCIVNTVFQVSTDGIIALSMSKNNNTHHLIQEGGRFSVSIITEETPAKTIGRLGFFSGRDCEKFDGLPQKEMAGLPVLDAACAGYMVARVLGSYDTGSHTVFFAKVEDAVAESSAPVMTYAYYHNVVKGKAPKNAPTYIAEQKG